MFVCDGCGYRTLSWRDPPFCNCQDEDLGPEDPNGPTPEDETLWDPLDEERKERHFNG